MHTLFIVQVVCAISLGTRNLELRFANKRATSLPVPGGDETGNAYIREQCESKAQLVK